MEGYLLWWVGLVGLFGAQLTVVSLEVSSTQLDIWALSLRSEWPGFWGLHLRSPSL